MARVGESVRASVIEFTLSLAAAGFVAKETVRIANLTHSNQTFGMFAVAELCT
jgi:hypothetical protein